jgi:hypothetical protein
MGTHNRGSTHTHTLVCYLYTSPSISFILAEMYDTCCLYNIYMYVYLHCVHSYCVHIHLQAVFAGQARIIYGCIFGLMKLLRFSPTPQCCVGLGLRLLSWRSPRTATLKTSITATNESIACYYGT